MERIVNSLTGIDREKMEDDALGLQKKYALKQDIKDEYAYFSHYITYLPPPSAVPPNEVYGLFGIVHTVNTEKIANIYNNLIYPTQVVYTIELLDTNTYRGPTDPNYSPIYIKLDNLTNEPYDFVISPSPNDKINNNIIHYFGHRFPSSLSLKIGHVLVNNGIGIYEDLNQHTTFQGATLFKNQQAYLMTFRLRIKTHHLF